jgi:hypothetical protein
MDNLQMFVVYCLGGLTWIVISKMLRAMDECPAEIGSDEDEEVQAEETPAAEED